MGNTLRTFVAFKLPSHIVDRAAALQSELRANGLKLRWVKPQNIHLTLKFLGDIPETDVPKIGRAIGNAVDSEYALDMTIQGMGVFPNIKRARVLWIGLGGQVQAMQRLHGNLEDQLVELGFKREKRGFKAHLTIARMKRGVAPKPLADALAVVGGYAPEPFLAQEVVFFNSDLRPQGPVYSSLVDWKLPKTP